MPSTTNNAHIATIDEVITTVIMARVTDFFGFFVYAIASALVFPRLFFPTFDPVTGTLLSFLVFSLAFIARPFASGLARVVQKKVGKPAKVALAMMILGTSTVAIGLLPGYDKIGYAAPLLLAAMRILQGVGLGGSWDGITLQLQNAAPENKKGTYAMVPQIGGPIGFCVAASLYFVLTGFLTEEEFINYGWRFAFFAVMAVNVVSLFARMRLLTTNFGAEESITKSSPFWETVQNQWRPIITAALSPLASYALFHMVTVFPLGYAMLYMDIPISQIVLLQLLGGVLAVGTTILSGILADKYGRALVRSISAGLTIILCAIIFTLESNPAFFILTGFAVLGLSHGQAGAITAGRFLRKYEYSSSALATNLSWIFGAAFAPLVALILASQFGLWAASLYLLSGVAVTLTTVWMVKETG